MHQTCSTCRYLRDHACCRYPTIVNVSPTYGCGEWKPLAEVARVFANVQKITDADVMRVIRESSTHSGLFTQFAREIVKKYQVCRRTAEDRMKRMAEKGTLIITEDDGVRYIEIEEKADLAFSQSEGTPETAEETQSRAQHTWLSSVHPVMKEYAKNLATAKSYSQLHRLCGKIGRSSFDRCMKEGLAAMQLGKSEDGLYYLLP